MYIYDAHFSLFLCTIFLSRVSHSWRLNTHLNSPSTFFLHPIRTSVLNSEPNDGLATDSKGSNEVDSQGEGWLMDLNEENVEGVFDLIRGQLASDGGGIKLNKIVDNEVHVTLTGSCVGCPYRSTTLKEVIESNLVKFLKSPNGNPICIKVTQGDS